MEKYQLKQTDEFKKEFEKLPNDIKYRFEKQIKKVEVNPYGIGKSLGYRWFRELKNKIYRVYYLVFDKEILVLFVNVSDKKRQKDTLNLIKQNMDIYKLMFKNRK